MPKKQIGILEEVYDRLKNFRDKQQLASFTQAIITLLNFYEGQEVEIRAFVETHGKKEIQKRVDEALASLDIARKSDLEKIVRKILAEQKVTA